MRGFLAVANVSAISAREVRKLGVSRTVRSTPASCADPGEVTVQPVVDDVVHRGVVDPAQHVDEPVVGGYVRRRLDVRRPQAVPAQPLLERPHRRAVQHELVLVERELPEEQVGLDEHQQRVGVDVEVLDEQLVREEEAG